MALKTSGRVRVIVSLSPRWDAASEADRIGMDVELCQRVATVAGCAINSISIIVVQVPDKDGLSSEYRGRPETQALSHQGGLYDATSHAVILNGNANAKIRFELITYAVLDQVPSISGTNLVGPLSQWLSDLALNLRNGHRLWGRGRLREEYLESLRDVDLRDVGQIRKAIDWAMSRRSMPDIVLAAARADNDGLPADTGDLETAPTSMSRIAVNNAICWFMIYSAGVYGVSDAGTLRLRTIGESRTQSPWNSGPGELRPIAETHGSREALWRFHRLVERKVGLGHVSDGVLLEWSEVSRLLGRDTATPEDDILR
jgi:hypothetical protein